MDVSQVYTYRLLLLQPAEAGLHRQTVRGLLRLRKIVGKVLSVGAILLAFAAGVAQTIFTTKWLPLPAIVVVSLVITSGLVASAQGAFRLAVKPNRQDRQLAADIHQAAIGLAVHIAKHTKIPLEHVGVSAWVVKRYRPWLKNPRLSRIVRFRVTNSIPPSDVDWTIGKGAVGQAWEVRRPTFHTWRDLCDKYGRDGKLTEAQWKGIAKRNRFGFTYQEYKSMLGKYSEVAAFPVCATSGSVIGVISIDIPYEAVDDNQSRLDVRDVRDRVVTMGELMRVTLQKSQNM